MINFQKKPVKLNEIQPLCSRFNISQILASVFVRRGITSNSELLFFLEDNLRFQHSPFCFCDIEDDEGLLEEINKKPILNTYKTDFKNFAHIFDLRELGIE